MNTAICSRISTYYFFLQVLTRCKFQNYLLIPNWLIKRQHYDATTPNSKGRGREGSREKEIHILTKWSFGTYIVVPNATWDGFWMKSAVFQRVSFHYTVNHIVKIQRYNIQYYNRTILLNLLIYCMLYLWIFTMWFTV